MLQLESRLKVLRRAALSIESHKPNLPHGRLRVVLGECWPPTKPFRILRVWMETPSKAASLAQTFRPQARFVILGHTHWAGIWRREQRVVINTGGFLVMARPLAVDIEDKTLTVRRVIKRGNQFRLGKVLERFAL